MLVRENSEYHNFGHSVTRKMDFLFRPKTKVVWVLPMKLVTQVDGSKALYRCICSQIWFITNLSELSSFVLPTQDRSYATFASFSAVF